jgi:hypothetical protein
VANTVMNRRLRYEAGKFLNSWAIISFSTKTDFRPVVTNEGGCEYGPCPVAGSVLVKFNLQSFSYHSGK